MSTFSFKNCCCCCHFTSKGSNFVHSVDGHDKLMGYQNSTYPLAVYGCIDTSSRKLLWIKVWVTNSNPKVVGRWYLEYLYECRLIASFLRMDKGTETGIMATMHAFLRNHHEDLDDASESVIYGPSTSIQIERWWKELHERLEKYFKEHLYYLKENRFYDPNYEHDRCTTQEAQQKIKYGLIKSGFPVTVDQLKEVAEFSGVLEVEDNFLDPEFRLKCNELVPNVEEIEPKDCRKAYLHLKKNFPVTYM
ncbi:uncharacterized protein LOC110254544 [Exaiptasia diaphana]|uniref:Integrase core domain-containing protein n=1 Tax=Exaiptasia diaphana TaxID=2652724 RepID=A0A913YA96_EXADI|nr:uncharacterized protein LOC110254544 [Exaiptasia diaphana]